jgi:predicted RNA methylase
VTQASAIEEALSWAFASKANPISARVVPGGSLAERQALSAVGTLIGKCYPSLADHDLPAAIREWMADGPSPPVSLVENLRELVLGDPDVHLAELYAGVVASANRRVLGTFFTPREHATRMVELWSKSEDPPSQVVDVGAGVGVFTALALRQWPSASVAAIDVNPVTLGLLAARLAQATGISAAPEHAALGRVDLVIDDFSSWLPRQPPALAGGRLILGNPPYTRWQLIPRQQRERLIAAADGLVDRRSSLAALLTAVSLRHLGPSDGLCFLLPALWLETDYAAPLRRKLLETKRRPTEIHLIDSRLFPDAQVDAVVLVIGRERDEASAPLIFSRWGEEPREVSRDRPADNWRAAISARTVLPAGTARAHAALSAVVRSRSLSDLAVVRRGCATGANAFFVLSERERIGADLDPRFLAPAIQRLKLFGESVSAADLKELPDTEARWLLMVTREDRAGDAELDQFISAAETDGTYPKRELCKRRKHWFDLCHDVFVPDLVIGPMSRRTNDEEEAYFRVVRNAAGAAITNNLYGIKWLAQTSLADREKTTLWLRSKVGQQAIREVSRQQASGLIKLEPGDLKHLQIPSRTP